MIRQYETTFIIDAHLPSEQLDIHIEKITKLLEKGGSTIKLVDRWGKRRLAYEINKKQYGYYVYLRYEADSDKLIEFEREYKLNEAIIRFLTAIVPKTALKQEVIKQDQTPKEEQPQKSQPIKPETKPAEPELISKPVIEEAPTPIKEEQKSKEEEKELPKDE